MALVIERSEEPVPRPLEGLLSVAPPPFVTKTYDIVEDPATDLVVSWSNSNNSFVVWDSSEFSRHLLPKFFKHNNFASFVRQLNTYGFRKVDPDRWEFANESFLKGQKHLLKNILRKKSASQILSLGRSSNAVSSLEVGNYGSVGGELETLKRHKNEIALEIVGLEQDQQVSQQQIRKIEQRLQTMERRQQHIITFLAKAMQGPSFWTQLMHSNEQCERLETTEKKRRRLQKQGNSGDQEESGDSSSEGQNLLYQFNSTESNRAKLLKILNSEVDMSSDQLENLLCEMGCGSKHQGNDDTAIFPKSKNGFKDVALTSLHSQNDVVVQNQLRTVAFPVHNQREELEIIPHSSETEGYSLLTVAEALEMRKTSMETVAPLAELSALETDGMLASGGSNVFWDDFLGSDPEALGSEGDVVTDSPEIGFEDEVVILDDEW